MRRTIAAPLAAAGIALTLLLSACSSGSGTDDPSPSASESAASDSATTSPEDVAALAEVTVTGDPGAQPTITLPSTPFTLSGTVARVVDEGTGAELEDGQVVVIDFVSVDGADGSVVSETYSSSPTTLTMGDDSIIQALTDALTGQKVGTRLLLGIGSTDSTQVMALDVVDARTVPTRAEGEAVAPVDGLPTVTLADDGEPSITPATGDAPTTLVAQPLIKGSGAAVESGQTVTVKYSGWLWDGTAFDSSWTKDTTFSFTVGSGQVIDGWDQGVAGQTVGSQVLLVVPPELGYGDTATGTIPAGSTLVFVVDILDATA